MKVGTVAGPVILVVLWAIISWSGLFNPVLFPSPLAVAAALWNLFASGHMGQDLLASLVRLVLGFAIAVVTGVPLGLVLGSAPWAHRLTEVPIDFARSIPASAMFPMFILLFGIGEAPKVALVAFSCALIIMVNTVYGVRGVHATRLLLARTLRMSMWQRFRKIILPESLPQVFAGFRVSVSIGLILVVVTEMFLGTHEGLGRRIFDSHLLFQVPEMYAAIVVTGLLGYILNKLFLLAEARLFHWVGR